MHQEQWNTLHAWFYTTGSKSKAIPPEVKDALETLIEERESEGDDDDYEDDDDEEEEE